MIKKAMFVFTLVLLLGGSALAFAWWDSLEQNETVTISVGDGVTLTVALDELASTEGNLVPAGVVEQDGQVESYVLTYDVNLDREIAETLNLSVFDTNVLVDNGTTLAQYVDIEINNAETIGNDTVVVTVTVTLNANSTTPEADVEALKNADITFDLTFEATQQETTE